MENDIEYKKRNNNRFTLGIILMVFGAIYLLNNFTFYALPYWLFSWPMWMIAAGIITGVKHNFRKPWSVMLIVIGAIFLVNMIVGFHYILFWPIMMIAVGIRLIFFKEGHWLRDRWERRDHWQ